MVVSSSLHAVGPRILGTTPEFSTEITFGSDEARNFSEGFRCDTNTFPPADVTWKLVNEEYPCSDEMCGVDVLTMNETFNFSVADSGVEEDMTLTINANLMMANLQYDQDGNFTCIASNGHSVASRSFRLRVKCT
jgi:hypothetical protein